MPLRPELSLLFQLVQSQLVPEVTCQFGALTFIREKRQLCRLIMPAIDHINGLAPPGFLAAIHFTRIEHLPLTDLAFRQSLVLDNGPVPMLLAVLYCFFARRNMPVFCRIFTTNQEGRSALQAVLVNRQRNFNMLGLISK